jgi:hypothetical protein
MIHEAEGERALVQLTRKVTPGCPPAGRFDLRRERWCRRRIDLGKLMIVRYISQHVDAHVKFPSRCA